MNRTVFIHLHHETQCKGYQGKAFPGRSRPHFTAKETGSSQLETCPKPWWQVRGGARFESQNCQTPEPTLGVLPKVTPAGSAEVIP